MRSRENDAGKISMAIRPCVTSRARIVGMRRVELDSLLDTIAQDSVTVSERELGARASDR